MSRPKLQRMLGWSMAMALCLGSLASAANPGESLSGTALKAKQAFRPLGDADLPRAKAPLLAAAERLNKRFETAGSSAAGWKAFLHWDALQSELKKAAPDQALLERTYRRLSIGDEGLGLVEFVDLRQSLRSYLQVRGALADKQLKPRFEAMMDALAKRLETCQKQPTPDDAFRIAAVVAYLADIDQASELRKQIGQTLRQPNLFVEVTPKVLGAEIAGPVNEVEPVRDCILGTSIFGTARLTGTIDVRMAPDKERAAFETVLTAEATSENVGYNGPAIIWSSGLTQLNGVKRIMLDANGLSAAPAYSTANTCSTITGVGARNGSKLIAKIATKAAARQKGKAEAIASAHAESRLNERMDSQAAETLAKNNAQFQQKFRAKLEERKLFPEVLKFSSTPDVMQVCVLEAHTSQLAAGTAPPPPPVGCDVVVRIHQSMVNNSTANALGGMVVREESLREQAKDLLGRVPDELKPDDEKEPWGITFAEQPITAVFGDGQFSITMRGRTFARGDNDYPGMNVTASYKIVQTKDGFRAQRQGELEIVPPDFESGRRRQLSGREQVIKTLLDKRFAKVFKPEMASEPIKLEGPAAKAGTLNPVYLSSKAGWLTVGLRLVPPAKVEPKKPQVAQR